MAELTYEHILELFAATDKKFEETDKQFKESDRRNKERDKRIEESEKRFTERLLKSSKEFEKIFARTNKQIADLGDTLGRFAEEQVRADLINKFDKCSFNGKSFYSTRQ